MRQHLLDMKTRSLYMEHKIQCVWSDFPLPDLPCLWPVRPTALQRGKRERHDRLLAGPCALILPPSLEEAPVSLVWLDEAWYLSMKQARQLLLGHYQTSPTKNGKSTSLVCVLVWSGILVHNYPQSASSDHNLLLTAFLYEIMCATGITTTLWKMSVELPPTTCFYALISS